jgi:guanylate kinase
VAGARQVRRAAADALLVFLEPPSWDVLRARLLGRGTESDEAVARRLAAAEQELAAREEFDEVIVNTEVPDTVETLVGFIT